MYIRKKRFIKSERIHLLQEAKDHFMKEKPQNGTLSDYKNALKRHFVTYSEYMYQYEFWKLTESERDLFVSRNSVRLIYYDIPWEVKRKFWNKTEFLKLFADYIYRSWLYVPCVSFEVFTDFIRSKECIAKPLNNCCGVGVFKISPYILNTINLKELYIQCLKDNILLEECIMGGKELQSFHPSSLNSIRVVTIFQKCKPIVFGAFLRMGTGDSVVDNAHAGGLFAQINVETGTIESDGIDVYGHTYRNHPDTNKPIKGFVILRWDEIKEVCMEAARIVPENPITGWDVVINQKGQIEFVEGNHGPDFDVMQSPLKVGAKKKLYSYLKRN